MLRPVSAHESVPDDVERLKSSLRSTAPSPKVGVNLPPAPRARPRVPERPAALDELEDLEELDAFDEALLETPEEELRPGFRGPGQTARSVLEKLDGARPGLHHRGRRQAQHAGRPIRSQRQESNCWRNARGKAFPSREDSGDEQVV